MADLRAPTPSAAAELAVPKITDIQSNVTKYQQRMKLGLTKTLDYTKLKYKTIMKAKAFQEPLRKIQDEYIQLDRMIKTMEDKIKQSYQLSQSSFYNILTKLDSLSPLKTLARGYSIVQKENRMITSKADLDKGDKINILLKDGNVNAMIE